MKALVPTWKLVTGLMLLALVSGSAGPAQAAFFQVAENCPSGLGNAFAGGAAIADNACTVWFNPAGMTRLEGKQLLFGVHSIVPSLDYNDRGSTIFLGLPLTGGDGGDAGEPALVPNIYYTHRVSDRLSFGVGINAPFGLTTDYEDGWQGRYHALRSEITTININPAIAFKVSDSFSIGLGLDYQTIDAELSQAIDFGSTCIAAQLVGQVPPGTCAGLGLAPQANDGKGIVSADDAAFGYNVGLLWEPGDRFRLGVHYRSAIDYDLEGDFRVETPNLPTSFFAIAIGAVDTQASAAAELPDSLSVSGFWQATSSWAFMADYTQVGWSSIQELRIRFASGFADSVSTFLLDDNDRYSVGAIWSPGTTWKVRFGWASDETPVPNPEVRSARLPDEDRTWYTLGFDWQRSPNFGLSVAYALVDIENAVIDKRAIPGTEDFLRGNLHGEYEFGINILSVGFSWRF